MSLFPKRAGESLPLFPQFANYNRVYCVDSVNGSDSNDGLGWERAFATIDAGVDAARQQLAGYLTC